MNAPARRMYEGAGLGPDDVDIFNPYDGYAPMAQFFLEAFQWHDDDSDRRQEAFLPPLSQNTVPVPPIVWFF
jgi:hypothetical protein